MAAYTCEVTVTFYMTNGSCFECKYTTKTINGCLSGPPEYCYPDETDVGDPEYFIDGAEVEFAKLPKGLDTVANAMYEGNSSNFDFTTTEREVDDGGYDYADDFRDDY